MENKKKPASGRRVLLSEMRPGERGRVAALLRSRNPAARRLMVLGFLPGEIFILERNSPEFLIRYGFTCLAMNRRAARGILVEILAGSPGQG